MFSSAFVDIYFVVVVVDYMNIKFTLGIVDMLNFSIVSLPCAFSNGELYLQIFITDQN